VARAGIVVVEDDAMVREWVRAVLEPTEFRLLATAEAAEEAVRVVEERKPELVLIDYRFPDQLGTDVVRQLRRRGNRARIIVMSATPERGLNESAREAGAQGTFVKSANVEELLDVLGRVLAGALAFDTRHPKRPPGRPMLSPRERQVLALVAHGATNREAAQELGIGEQTVKTLLARTYVKLGVGRRSEAVAAAYEAGLLRRA
jgi:DNA-binding NarL/FixJ family response regulator